MNLIINNLLSIVYLINISIFALCYKYNNLYNNKG